MVKKSFGDIVKKRTYQFLDSMLRLVNFEVYDQDNFEIKFDIRTERTIIIKTTVKNLVYLTRACGYQLDSHHIKESLHCLKTLKIIEDHRVNKKGNHLWHFSLKIWHSCRNKNLNLERFNHGWDKFKEKQKETTIINPQQYNNQGIQNYLEGNFEQAIQCFKKAINLDSGCGIAHYNLGYIYEQLQDFEQASCAYRQAILGGLGAAYNNLGRLLILQKKYSQGFNLLLQGLNKAQFKQEKYAIWKNLGWIRLEQKRYLEAETYLLQAWEIDEKQGAIQYLLAQTWEGLGKWPQAALAYENYLRYSSYYKLEEDEWIHVARQKIK